MKLLLISIFSLMFLSSCSTYMASLYREIDKNDPQLQNQPTKDQFDMYRKSSKKNFQKSSIPSENRQYATSEQINNEEMTKRVKARDIEDNGSDGSLWSGESSNVNYLFSKNSIKRTGDIILINVLDDLKKEITLELRRQFPDNSGFTPATTTATVADQKTLAPNTSTAPAQSNPATNLNSEENNEKVHDKISSVIVEEISREHLLIRGRKEILFRGKKRLVELEALAARKEISENNTVDSDKFIETRITIVK